MKQHKTRWSAQDLGKNRWRLAGLMAALAIALVFGLTGQKPAQANPSAITITVDTREDLVPTSLTHTCTYTEGAFFFPAADGKCTLRRALREAGARPDADRPITIAFNLPAGEAVDGVWTVELQSTTLELKRKNLSVTGGQVILDGDTQPGGRPRAEGPKIMIDTNDNSFEIRTENNQIRNLGFQGGGVIFLYEDNNLIEDNWMGLSNDGQQIVFRDSGQPNSRMAGGGVFIRSSDNIIRNNVITGAFAKAVDINSGNQNNLIENNRIGTRADGTVPTPFACTGGVADPGSWYGGWGIALAGTNNKVIGNRIAGLDNIRSGNDTPPRAIEIFGNTHEIRDNIIGVDSAGNKVGVCGQGIKVSDVGTDILDNTIVGSKQDSEDAVKAAILTTGNSTGITVRGNIVEDGPEKIYDFGGTTVPQALRIFNPARITGIDGVNISGASGANSPCPNCRVGLYLDDADEIDEALEYLGEATANAQGNFTFTLSSPLQPGFGLRTMSTTSTLNVIPGQQSTTTTKNSILYLPVSAVTVTLPATATVGVSVPVTLTVAPIAAAASLTYTIESTGLSNRVGTFSQGGSAVTTLVWDGIGAKTVNVTVENEFSSAMTSGEIVESIPGLLISSPLLGEGMGIPLDQLDSMNEFSIGDVIRADEEGFDDVSPDLPQDPDRIEEGEIIQNIVIEDMPESCGEETRSRFLGDALSLSEPFESKLLTGKDAKRAVQSLADAREQVDSGNLLKGKQIEDGKEDPIEVSAVPAVDDQVSSAIEEVGPPQSVPKSLRLRFDFLAARLRDEFSARSCVFFDDLGNELYRADEEEGQGGRPTLSSASSWGLLESHHSPGVTQVTSGEGDRWTCLVRGIQPAAHLGLRFELEEPAETEQLMVLPGLLTEVLYRENNDSNQ